MSVAPKAFAYQGWDRWPAVVFFTDVVPDAVARRRILALLEPDDAVFRTEVGYVLRFGTPRRFRAEQAPGGVVAELRARGPVSAIPKWSAAGGDAADLWVARAGQAIKLRLDATTRVDPSTWIDTAGLRWIVPRALEPPPTKLREPAEPPPSEALLADGRPAYTDKQKQAVDAIRRNVERSVRDVAPIGEGGSALRIPPGPTLFDKIANTVSKWMMASSPLASALGRRQARYMNKLMGMFEAGRLADALRHAIPMGALGAGSKRPALTAPSPRASLRITRHATHASSSVMLPPDFLAQLTEHYRAAAKKLEDAGEIEQAAFVYFELLRDDQAGIALLERHERYTLAAELAEARELDPALVVRLWFLAKDPARGIAVARRTGAFAKAVRLLEQRQPRLATTLRLVWADHAASDGDFATAIEAVWPVESARSLALRWFDEALSYAGPQTRAKLLVRKVDLMPEGVGAVLDSIRDDLRAADPMAVQFRIALGQQLGVEASSKHGAKPMGRPVARALLRDLDGPYGAEAKAATSGLMRRLVDTTLRSDLPPLRAGPTQAVWDRSEPLELEVPPTDAGAATCREIAALPDGGALVALGEAGVVHLDPHGRTRTTYDRPADALVVATTGYRALALKHRGDVTQVARLELGRRSATWWADLQVRTVASRLVGGMWFVVTDDALSALDTLGSDPGVLWRVPLSPDEHISTIHATQDRLFALAHGDGWIELWEFELPSLVLRNRHEIRIPWRPEDGAAAQVLVRTGSRTLMMSMLADDPGKSRMFLFELGHPGVSEHGKPASPMQEVEGHRVPLCGTDEVLLWTVEAADKQVLVVTRRKDLRPVMLVRCPGATAIAADVAADRVWASDDLGRSWGIDLRRSAVLGPWPIRSV